MPATMTTVSAITKEVYEQSLQEQLLDEMTTLKRVEKTSEGVVSEAGGKYVVFPVEISRNAGIGARQEMEALPTPGQQGTATARVPLRYMYGSLRLSGQLFELAKSAPQAFMSALDLEMNGLKGDLVVDLNRQVYGNGTGRVATATAVQTASTVSVKHTYWMQIGMVVDQYDSTGVTQKASSRTITAVTVPGAAGTATITLSGAAITTAVGDFFCRTGSVGTASLSTQREWTGLEAIVQSSGALFNLTDPVWTSTVDSNAGVNRALSEGLMTANVDAVRLRGGTTSVLFSNLGVRRAYANLLVQQRRFTNTQEFTGGFSGLAFTTDKGDIPMVVDTFCPPNTLYGLNEKVIKWYREHDFKFMDRDGSMWQRVIGYDAYDATLFQYSELGTHRRNSHFVMQDITEG